MANYEATKYDFDGANLTGIEGTATGTIVPWSAASLPSGFLECNGQTVSRSTYSALFAIVGTTYGAGDGSTTFLVPDLQDNTPVGKSGSKALGTTGGANTATSTGNVGGSTANATLTTAQLASHLHTMNAYSAVAPNGNGLPFDKPLSVSTGNTPTPALSPTSNTGSGSGHSHNMSATFSGDATSVLQPYLALIYIIKT